MMFDFIVVGCGYAGAISARLIAEKLNKKVLIIEKRNHIAGNMYDEVNQDNILVHQYGPHISVMNNQKTYDFLSRFTEWIPYEHHVNAEIDGKEVPLPFNLTAIDILFEKNSAQHLKQLLIDEYGMDTNVPILQLRQSKASAIRNLAEFVYNKVFLHYTQKMWGLTPEQIDPSVTGRVPVRISYTNRHFLHRYQVMPKEGFTELFQKILNHPNITIRLNTNALDVLSLDFKKYQILFQDNIFHGDIIYTGALDELMRYRYGVLPYRSLRFDIETHSVDYVQNTAVLNWPDERPATRRTEMKRLTQQIIPGKTTTITEYPGEYVRHSDYFSEPYYPIIQQKNIDIYNQYLECAKQFRNLKILGRLADYKYYNMEDTVLKALDFFERNYLRKGSY